MTETAATTTNLMDILDDLLAKAKAAGADAADAVTARGASTSVAVRLGKVENLEGAEGTDVGLRVLVGKRQALVSSGDTSREALAELAERAVAMARTVPEDPLLGLADPGQLATSLPEIDMCDPGHLDADALVERALACEDAGRAVAGITNSNGAEAAWAKSTTAIAGTNGFARTFDSSRGSLSASFIAGDGEAGMETDYDYTTAVYAADMHAAADVGQRAAERTVRRLGAIQPKGGRLPIVFDPRQSRGLLGAFLGAINGASVARGSSFLRAKMGQAVFAPGVTVHEDPHRPRGLRSKPCDAEGLPNGPHKLIDGGVLTTWLLDLRSSRKLEMAPTGHAARGVGSSPSPSATNVWLAAGPRSVADMLGAFDRCLYVTDMVGQGVNMVTGDYSRGAAGFLYEKGMCAGPVNQFTVAGNLADMFARMEPADDLVFEFGVDAPAVLIEDMAVAGA